MEQTLLSSKSEQKSRAILVNAVAIFARDGYANADVQVIADEAGVGKGTVYRHFGTKEQLFWAASEYCLDQIREYVREHVFDRLPHGHALQPGDVADLLHRIACALAEYYQSHLPELDIFIQGRTAFRGTASPIQEAFQAHYRERLDGLVRLISAAMGGDTIRGWEVKAVCIAFLDTLYGTIISGYVEGEHHNLVQRVDSAVQILLHGIVVFQNSSPSVNLRHLNAV